MLDKGINGFMSERLVVILVRMFLHLFIYVWVYFGTVLGTGFDMVDLSVCLTFDANCFGHIMEYKNY